MTDQIKSFWFNDIDFVIHSVLLHISWSRPPMSNGKSTSDYTTLYGHVSAKFKVLMSCNDGWIIFDHFCCHHMCCQLWRHPARVYLTVK